MLEIVTKTLGLIRPASDRKFEPPNNLFRSWALSLLVSLVNLRCLLEKFRLQQNSGAVLQHFQRCPTTSSGVDFSNKSENVSPK